MKARVLCKARERHVWVVVGCGAGDGQVLLYRCLGVRTGGSAATTTATT